MALPHPGTNHHRRRLHVAPRGGEGSTSLSAAGRDLLTPDEVLRLPPELQILRLQGRTPVLARKLRHFADPEFRGLFAFEEDRATA